MCQTLSSRFQRASNAIPMSINATLCLAYYATTTNIHNHPSLQTNAEREHQGSLPPEERRTISFLLNVPLKVRGCLRVGSLWRWRRKVLRPCLCGTSTTTRSGHFPFELGEYTTKEGIHVIIGGTTRFRWCACALQGRRLYLHYAQCVLVLCHPVSFVATESEHQSGPSLSSKGGETPVLQPTSIVPRSLFFILASDVSFLKRPYHPPQLRYRKGNQHE